MTGDVSEVWSVWFDLRTAMLILTAIDLYIPEKKWSIVRKSGLEIPDQKPTGLVYRSITSTEL